LTAQIAALSEEAKLADFGDVLRASKKLQAMEEAGERVESLQHLKDLGDACSRLHASSRVAAFATTHDLTAPLAALSEKAQLATFGQMLAASKPLKELEARGERVRDLQHLTDLARPERSAAGQAGSHRQVNALDAEWLWKQYKGHIGERPVAASGNPPLLFSLRELSVNDQDGVFDGLVRTMLNVTRSCWAPYQFSKSNGVDKIRQTIHDETLEQYGVHIGNREPGATQKRLDCIRKIQAKWDKQAGTHSNTPWQPPRPHNHSQLKRAQQSYARRAMISDKYNSMKREVQINVVKTLSDTDRTRLAVHLALVWYAERVRSAAASAAQECP
jgi:hypothetical protein